MTSLIIGTLFLIIGFIMYSYFRKNEESIDNKPGNLYGIAVLVILMGAFMLIFSILQLVD